MDNHSAIKRLESLTKIHTESFNFAISQGLHYINFEFLSEMIKDKKDWKRENFFITNFLRTGNPWYLGTKPVSIFSLKSDSIWGVKVALFRDY